MNTEKRQMTKAEREDLIRLVKQRERVAKTAAEQRSSAMLADFEQQVSALHAFDRNEVWRATTQVAIEAAKKANEEIAKEAERLGIPRSSGRACHITGISVATTRWRNAATSCAVLPKPRSPRFEKPHWCRSRRPACRRRPRSSPTG